LGVAALLAVSAAVAQTPTKTRPVASSKAGKKALRSRVGPAELYPDPVLTPGLQADTSVADLMKRWPCPRGHRSTAKDGLCSYSEAHRDVPEAEKARVYAEYESLHPGITVYCKAIPSGSAQRCEVDHLYPECAGGSNAKENLWVQRADSTYNGRPMGFHQKDDLETELCKEITHGTLKPKGAFACLANDWVRCYLDKKPPHVGFARYSEAKKGI
jgi:hypothetical protein